MLVVAEGRVVVEFLFGRDADLKLVFSAVVSPDLPLVYTRGEGGVADHRAEHVCGLLQVDCLAVVGYLHALADVDRVPSPLNRVY